ncbi:MAG: hypothetical protein NZ845_01000 [Thermodesulfovibrio sp.]|nr:hypothetical protein [Thermodesulfovibrio sp.]MDW7973133.1 hypothetical protein [Thermodesulfovibrio sp.]
MKNTANEYEEFINWLWRIPKGISEIGWAASFGIASFVIEFEKKFPEWIKIRDPKEFDSIEID